MAEQVGPETLAHATVQVTHHVVHRDRDGRLWRFQEGHLLNFYENLSSNCGPVLLYDLKDGRYFVNRLIGEDLPPVEVPDMKARDFLPDSVRQRYSR